MTQPDDIRDVVLRWFESTRQAPGTDYEPDRLLAYLTAPPAATGRRVADTFAGRRRFLRFMDAVQFELGFCFTKDEWERGFGLDNLVEAISAKLGNPKAQKLLAQKRVREIRTVLIDEPIKFGLIAGLVLLAPIIKTRGVVRIALVSIWALVVVGTAIICLKQYRYAQKLAARISQRADA